MLISLRGVAIWTRIVVSAQGWVQNSADDNAILHKEKVRWMTLCTVQCRYGLEMALLYTSHS